MPIAQPAWFIRFGVTFAVTFAICWAIPSIYDEVPDFPLINSDRPHVRILNHYFGSPAPVIALAGSSLTERLKEPYFERRDLRNLGFGGGSPLTGLTVLAGTAWKRPAVVAIEANIMSRGVDQIWFMNSARSTTPSPPLRPSARSLRSINGDWMALLRPSIPRDVRGFFARHPREL